MVAFEQAIFEASQFSTNEKTRFDLDYIQVEEHKVVATDGKRLYVAYPDTTPPLVGHLKLAKIKDGKHSYPKPRQQSADQGSRLVQVDGKEYLDTLGTRFQVVKADVKFPQYEKIIPHDYAAIVLDHPELFVSSLRTLYQHGKTMAQEHLFATGEKIVPKYRVVIYRNGALHLVTECRWEDTGNFLPVAHTKLATLSECSAIEPVLSVFNPDFYPLKVAPVAIALIAPASPIIFELPSRKVVIMPIHMEDNDTLRQKTENFLCWEECENEVAAMAVV